MKYIFLLFFIAFTSLNASNIRIAVAANVSYAMDDLIKKFNQQHPNISVKTVLGSSGKLTAQIYHGAPYDIFISANMKYPTTLYKNKIAINPPVIYALGSLALFSNKNIDFSNGLYLLKDKKISKIAIANPKTAPYGQAALEAIKNAKILKDINKKFVYAESIAQNVSYALTATDIGIIAKSSLYSPKMSDFKEGINWIEVDSKLYTPIKQGIVMLKNSKEIKKFYDFILSDDAKKIFKDYGYLLP
jgi:molybdate transport system substrate-binding protein